MFFNVRSLVLSCSMLFCVAPYAAADEAAADAKAKELEKLQGAWIYIGGETAGEKISPPPGGAYKLVFTGNKMKLVRDISQNPETEIDVDPSVTPKTITVIRQVPGEEKQTVLGIYSLDDNNKLTICADHLAGQRPKDFSTQGKPTCSVRIYIREANAAAVLDDANSKEIARYTEAIRLDPEDPENYLGRAAAWTQKGDLEKAIADYTSAIKLDATDALTFNNRGIALRDSGNYEKALADFNEMLRLDPELPLGYNELAWTMAICPDPKFRNAKKSVELATKASELTEWKEGGVMDTLAAAYADAGDFNEAVKWQQKAIDLIDNDELLPQMRAKLKLFKEGKPYREYPKKQAAGKGQ